MGIELQTTSLDTIKLSELPEAIALNESDYSLIVQNGTSKKIKGLLLKGNAGDNGKSIEIRKTDTHIQWRQEEGQWINLVALADLKGDKGEQGGGSNVDLTDYATKVWVTQQLASYYTKTEINSSLSNKANISHTHISSDITDLSIPTNVSELNNDVDFATKTYVNNKIAEASLSGGEVDLSGYAPIDNPSFTGYISMNRKADTTVGHRSIALGDNNEASGQYSFAEGKDTKASGYASHAEGELTIASVHASHAEGSWTIASGWNSHAEGSGTIASGDDSHAEGNNTIASSENQHVQGKNNIEDTENKYAHIVGNGETDTARSNAYTLDWNGNAWYAGKLTQEGVPTEDKDLATKKYVDSQISTVELTPGPKGDKGDPGENGKDGLTTSISVNSTTYTHVDGTITLPDYPTVPTKVSQLTNDSSFATESYVTNKIAEASLSGGEIDLSGYATKEELNNKADKTAIPTKTSQLENDSDYLKSTDTIDANSLNGKRFSEPMTKQEYDAIVDKDSNTIYLISDDTSIESVPSYSVSEANKILAVNSDGNALGWIDPPTGSGSGLTTEQVNQLTAAYNHSQSPHVQNELIPITENEYNNLQPLEKVNKFYAITDSVEEEYSLQLVGNTIKLLKGNKIISSIILPTVSSGGSEIVNGEIVISEENISIKKGNSKSINISLASAPTNSQIVNINCDNSNITVNPSQLTFNSSNYSNPQAVTISVNSAITESSSIVTVSSENVSIKNISLEITEDPPITDDNITSVTDGLIHSYDFSQGSGTQTILNDLTGNCNIKLMNFTFNTGETQNCGWNNDGSLSTNNSNRAYASIDTTSEEYNLDNHDFTIAFKAQINGSCYILSSTSNKASVPETGICSINYANNRSITIKTGNVNTPASTPSLANKVPYGTTDVFVVTYSVSTRTVTMRNSAEVLGETVLDEGVEVKTMKYIFSSNYNEQFGQDTNKIYKLAIYNKCLSNEEISTVISDLA